MNRETSMLRDQLVEWFAGRMMPDGCNPNEFVNYVPLKGSNGQQVVSPTGCPVYIGGYTWGEHYNKLAEEEVNSLLAFMDMHGVEIAQKQG